MKKQHILAIIVLFLGLVLPMVIIPKVLLLSYLHYSTDKLLVQWIYSGITVGLICFGFLVSWVIRKLMD